MQILGQFLTGPLVHSYSAQGLGIYERSAPPYLAGTSDAEERRTLVLPAMKVAIGSRGYHISTETELDLNEASSWDATTPTDYTAPLARAGKDVYIFACQPASGRRPVFLLSCTSGAPAGYTTATSRKIGRFHCLPYVTAPTWVADTVTTVNYVVQPVTPGAAKLLYKCTSRAGDYKTHATTEPTWPTTAGETVVDDQVTWTCVANACQNLAAGHPYKDFEAGSIIFNSIQDLLDCPSSEPEGMAKISLTPHDGKKGLWVDIYLASGTGTSLTSVFGATIKDTVSWESFVDYGRLQGKRLLDDDEFQNAAYGSNEQTNIAGSADPGTVTFPLDAAGMSMISHYGVIGACGIMYQWLVTQCYRFDPDGSAAAATKTLTAYHAASPGGNPIYIKYLADGAPYLCCNLSSTSADKWLTFGTDYKILVKHDADAATGGIQLYIDEDATQPGRLLAATTRLKNTYIQSNNPTFQLQITYNAAPGTPGVAINFDDGADQRLEFISPTSANGTIDLAALGSAAFTYHNMSSKGSRYGQGVYGDTKLRAGGNWNDGSLCGSRCRNLASWPWCAYSFIGGRFCADPA